MVKIISNVNRYKEIKDKPPLGARITLSHIPGMGCFTSTVETVDRTSNNQNTSEDDDVLTAVAARFVPIQETVGRRKKKKGKTRLPEGVDVSPTAAVFLTDVLQAATTPSGPSQ
jgi:hypothetical protein